MLFDKAKEASIKFMEGLITEQEYVNELIVALGDWQTSDTTVVELADALEKYQGSTNEGGDDVSEVA
jgi:hypothetical protein